MEKSLVPRNGKRQLSDVEKTRLEQIAPLFQIDFCKLCESSYRLCVLDGSLEVECTVSAQIAHTRLLAELCAKTLNWVHYHPAEHVADSLLSQSDSRIRRISELYLRWCERTKH